MHPGALRVINDCFYFLASLVVLASVYTPPSPRLQQKRDHHLVASMLSRCIQGNKRSTSSYSESSDPHPAETFGHPNTIPEHPTHLRVARLLHFMYSSSPCISTHIREIFLNLRSVALWPENYPLLFPVTNSPVFVHDSLQSFIILLLSSRVFFCLLRLCTGFAVGAMETTPHCLCFEFNGWRLFNPAGDALNTSYSQEALHCVFTNCCVEHLGFPFATHGHCLQSG